MSQDNEEIIQENPAVNAEELQDLVSRLEQELGRARVLLKQVAGKGKGKHKKLDHLAAAREGDIAASDDGSMIIEGVFDGQHMVGPDGKLYSVPANYASKSKLVEGDMLKLTIQADGTFVYKQINPIARQRLVGILTKDPSTGNWQALAGGKSYNLITASVTYFKGQPGDAVVILVPKETTAVWAAVENIIHEDVLQQAGEKGEEEIKID